MCSDQKQEYGREHARAHTHTAERIFLVKDCWRKQRLVLQKSFFTQGAVRALQEDGCVKGSVSVQKALCVTGKLYFQTAFCTKGCLREPFA